MTIEDIKNEIGPVIDEAATIAEMFAPQYAGFIVLGQAVAKVIPELANDVQRLLTQTEVTQDDEDALAAKLHKLANPEEYFT